MPKTIEKKSAQLHRQLINGDLVASALLAELLLPNVSRILRAKYFNVQDTHLHNSATNDAILNYLKNPEKYDPLKSSLLSYVVRFAEWRLLSALRRNTDLQTEFVELGPLEGVSLYDSESHAIDDDLISAEEEDLTLRNIAMLLPNPADQQMVIAMMNGSRDTKEFAQILGITNLTDESQKLEVKRNKDRIKSVIKRRFKAEYRRD